jgi:hypothetical protein
MANAPKPGSLLDTLRAQSTAVRAQGEAARKPVEEVLADMDRQLWRAFRWLDEALGHLEVIKPQVAHRFAIPGVVTIDRPQFERGFVSYRRRHLAGQELLAHIDLFYRLLGPQTLIVKVHPGSALSVEDRLRPTAMPYQYMTETDENRVVRFGVFHITPAISANVRFEPDYHRQLIEVVLRNVDRFEAVQAVEAAAELPLREGIRRRRGVPDCVEVAPEGLAVLDLSRHPPRGVVRARGRVNRPAEAPAITLRITPAPAAASAGALGSA